MIQPNYEQMPNNLYPQAGGANAVSINIYNPQAYGSTQPVAQAPYNYTNSVYNVPQAQVYSNQNQAQVPPQQYFIPNLPQQQTPVAPQQAPVIMNQASQPIVTPVAPQQAPVVMNQTSQPIIAPAPQLMPDSVIVPQQEVQPIQQDNKVDEQANAQQAPAAEENVQPAAEPENNIPSVDTEALIKDLRSDDASFKGNAINKIAEYAQEKPEIALQVVAEPVMQALVDVIKEDTTGLEGPTDKQIEVAEKISKGEQLTPEEEALSDQLSPRDKANKNRIFALYTLAMIQKLQRDELNQYIETQKANGEKPIEPLNLEDLIGYGDMVNTIKNDQRPEVKVAAIQALEHVAEPNEKAKVEEVLADSLKSSDEHIKAAAEEAVKKLSA